MYNVNELKNFWIIPIIRVAEEKGYCSTRLQVNTKNPEINMSYMFKNIFTQLTAKYDLVRYDLLLFKQRNRPYEITTNSSYPLSGWSSANRSNSFSYTATNAEHRNAFPFIFFEAYRLSKLGLPARQTFANLTIQSQIRTHNNAQMDLLVNEFTEFALAYGDIWEFSIQFLGRIQSSMMFRNHWTVEQFLSVIESSERFIRLLINIKQTATYDAITASQSPAIVFATANTVVDTTSQYSTNDTGLLA